VNIVVTGRVVAEDKVARSKYIYFVRKTTCELLAAFTVKHEANLWMLRTGWPLEEATLSRMRDGVYEDKTETIIPWSEA